MHVFEGTPVREVKGSKSRNQNKSVLTRPDNSLVPLDLLSVISFAPFLIFDDESLKMA